jgi:hypothetical protein
VPRATHPEILILRTSSGPDADGTQPWNTCSSGDTAIATNRPMRSASTNMGSNAGTSTAMSASTAGV